jgi:predicted metal-dependent hydrolase
MESASSEQLSLWGDEGVIAAPSAVATAESARTDHRTMAEQGGLQAAVCAIPCFRHPRADREIHFSKAIVAYEFKRAQRRSIGMVVGTEGLSVRAPRWISHGDVERALRAKERWICQKLLEQKERGHRQAAARIDWRDGATVPFLGQSLVLCLDPTVAGVQRSATSPGLLRVGLSAEAEPAQIRDTVHAWLQREARALFAERVAHFAARLGVSVKRVSLSSARTRWGSASADGSIRLHWGLVHFSPQVVDYVVAHELAHLREMNHSPRFWEVVRSLLPDFEEPRQSLRSLSVPG